MLVQPFTGIQSEMHSSDKDVFICRKTMMLILIVDYQKNSLGITATCVDHVKAERSEQRQKKAKEESKRWRK